MLHVSSCPTPGTWPSADSENSSLTVTAAPPLPPTPKQLSPYLLHQSARSGELAPGLTVF